jgi:hypothetical protein
MDLRHKIFFIISFCLSFLKSNSQTRIQELSAVQYNQNVIISYLISAGNSCAGYQILKSNDSLNFDVIFDYAGICGESTKSQNITYSDESPQKNKKNYYKVLIQPSDYSNVISVFYTDLAEKGYLLMQNPITQNLSLVSDLNSGDLKIYNQMGTLTLSVSPNEQGLYHKDISWLENGIYYFILENAKGKLLHGKFIKE